MKTAALYFSIVLFMGLILCGQSYDNFWFSREINCTSQDKKGHCNNWNQTTVLYRYSDYIFYCFPGDLYVLTERGPVQMRQLKLEDQVFGMNLQTGRNQFSKVTAWLHHDPTSLYQYSVITVQNQDWKFLGSSYHNFAFSNNHQTDFKFLKDLQKDDSLIGLTEDGIDFKVDNTQSKIQKQGLYSPFTQTGTFYIYPDNFNQSEYNNNKQFPMILVHSLSQIKHPAQNFNKANNFIKTSGLLFDPYQPTQDQEYTNTLISNFRFIFSSDWVQAGGQKIAHRTSTYGSYSSTRNRRQQEQKRRTAVVLAVEAILFQTLLQ